jgi:sec-independent protein translocase protein TatA
VIPAWARALAVAFAGLAAAVAALMAIVARASGRWFTAALTGVCGPLTVLFALRFVERWVGANPRLMWGTIALPAILPALAYVATRLVYRLSSTLGTRLPTLRTTDNL